MIDTGAGNVARRNMPDPNLRVIDINENVRTINTVTFAVAQTVIRQKARQSSGYTERHGVQAGIQHTQAAGLSGRQHKLADVVPTFLRPWTPSAKFIKLMRFCK